jgi:hypothetical protein
MKLHKRLNGLYLYRRKLVKKRDKFKAKYYPESEREIIRFNHTEKIRLLLETTNKEIKKTKEKLYVEFEKHKGIRELDKKCLTKHKVISVFDSVLTRTVNMQQDELYEDIMIVQTYFFDVIEDIILDGYMYNREKYICLTASAGQIRTKKTVFIKQSIYNQYKNTLMCGLTIDDINNSGGVNINKYLAYLALCNSATDIWEDFDITKSIVVDDMETMVNGIVDFIDDTTYEITRKQMDIPITHTDGCGMYLPRVNKKNMMVRLPWIKGLLVSFPFDRFIQEINKNTDGKYYGLVTDIYGKEWNILKDGIEVIFTKSQFKMWKYYSSWKDYCDKYQQYNCQAGKCNEEEDTFNNAKINYQMLQTLTDMTYEDLEKISKTTVHNIKSIGTDKKTMLKALGVVPSNKNKNYIQQALDIYPELLNDTYSKEILKQVKKSIVRDGRAGKVDINGVYTFLSPDLYAFCEYLFLGDKNPKGLLNDGEVFCKLYKNIDKLDCLRSPHLYREHAIRKNVVDSDKSKWFTTDAIYTSCHDLISKILQFDNDGDKSLVCAEKTIIEVAERNMKNIVPLYYNMRKAPAEKIDNQTIYNGLKAAYTGGNIGMISNDITKIWNSDNINIDVIKLLCMENNFTIDYAKTLYKPERPKNKKKLITDYTKSKVPHFFIYAKDKKKEEVEKINNSVVNMLEKIIPNPKISFNSIGLGKFDYKVLMKNKKVKLDNTIINKYQELDLKKHFMINSIEDEDEATNIPFIYRDIKKAILETHSDIYYIVDVLVEYLYNRKQSNYKTTLWECFGNIIIENIKNNILSNSVSCERCGRRIISNTHNKKYCDECAKEVRKEQVRINVKNLRNRDKM